MAGIYPVEGADDVTGRVCGPQGEVHGRRIERVHRFKPQAPFEPQWKEVVEDIGATAGELVVGKEPAKNISDEINVCLPPGKLRGLRVSEDGKGRDQGRMEYEVPGGGSAVIRGYE